MKSMTRTTPSSVWNVVSSTSVFAVVPAFDGADPARRRELPAAVLGRPEQRANTAPESKRGTHIQSMEPSLPTSAAVCVSPMRA